MLTVLFPIDFPENAEMVMIMFLKLCALDFFETEKYLQSMFAFRETKAFSTVENEDGEEYSKFAEAGYENANYYALLGPIFFFLIGLLILVLVTKVLYCLVQKCNDNFVTRRLKKKIQWLAFFVRFLLESCVEIGLSAMIAVKMVSVAVL